MCKKKAGRILRENYTETAIGKVKLDTDLVMI